METQSKELSWFCPPSAPINDVMGWMFMNEKDLKERENSNAGEGIIQKYTYEGIDLGNRVEWNREGSVHVDGLMI